MDSSGRIQTPDPYFVGGIGTALGQVFRRNFPSEQGGFFFQAPIRNNQAQADHAIDQLAMRQSQLTTQRDLNRVQVDVLNNVIALQQARARYDAAVQNQRLQQELFEGEQKKFQAGASTAYDVVQQQRDLTTAQAAQISALTTYTTSRIALDQTLGTILEANKIQLK
jgi:outer membrane protein TolC